MQGCLAEALATQTPPLGQFCFYELVTGVGVGDLRFAYRARSFFSFQVAARNTNQTIETLNVYLPRNLEGWEGIEHSNTDSTPRAVITTVTMKSRVQNKNVHAT